jgi:hypothetical protein
MSAWRPPNWKTNSPAKVVINFPGQGQAAQYSSSASGSSVVLPNSPTNYAFDAEIQIEHQQELRRTEHPVQTGASISDHAYIVPARLVMEVGMSDAMDAYFNPSTWSGSTSKSVSAYLTMIALQFSRIPLQITTKLRVYKNMIVESVTPTETAKTFGGLRMRIEFGQMFLADITTVTASARNQDTGTTTLGVVDPQNPSDAQQQQNAVPPTYVPWNAIGAGSYSSVPVANSNSLPSK